jgi:hypothetical protein
LITIAQAPQRGRMTGLACQGILLFAFIPLVLFLFLRQPLGPLGSLIVGLALMFGHRFLAAPWMARHAKDRCLWCARVPDSASTLEVRAGGRLWAMASCGDEHRLRAGRFLTFLDRFRVAVSLGIFIPLSLLLGGSLASALGHPLLSHELNALQFRVAVAATVVAASVGYLAVPSPAGTLACPFPLHNLFLLGIGNTLWVFRLVGTWWLVDGFLRLF